MLENLGHSLRRLREDRRISLKVLAEQTGFSSSFLSQVENSLASPSISSMERIATALGVTLSQFFNHAEASRGSVVRGSDRACLNLEWSLAEIESAGALDRGRPTLRVSGKAESRRFERKASQTFDQRRVCLCLQR